MTPDPSVERASKGWRPWTPINPQKKKHYVSWAARIAKACRCDQELRVF